VIGLSKNRLLYYYLNFFLIFLRYWYRNRLLYINMTFILSTKLFSLCLQSTQSSFLSKSIIFQFILYFLSNLLLLRRLSYFLCLIKIVFILVVISSFFSPFCNFSDLVINVYLFLRLWLGLFGSPFSCDFWICRSNLRRRFILFLSAFWFDWINWSWFLCGFWHYFRLFSQLQHNYIIIRWLPIFRLSQWKWRLRCCAFLLNSTSLG
jgi:hypothetical protein